MPDHRNQWHAREIIGWSGRITCTTLCGKINSFLYRFISVNHLNIYYIIIRSCDFLVFKIQNESKEQRHQLKYVLEVYVDLHIEGAASQMAKGEIKRKF